MSNQDNNANVITPNSGLTYDLQEVKEFNDTPFFVVEQSPCFNTNKTNIANLAEKVDEKRGHML
jgi:hypothetical protein